MVLPNQIRKQPVSSRPRIRAAASVCGLADLFELFRHVLHHFRTLHVILNSRITVGNFTGLNAHLCVGKQEASL